MSRIELAAEIAEDFDRILDHLGSHEALNAASRIDSILSAIDVLASNPLIGRPTLSGNRELVIGQGAAGYIALYRYLAKANLVLVLAIRRQREAGYAER